MLQVLDPYRVLQVTPDAEPEVIQAAYRALARKYHPDMGGSDLQMAKLNAAWETVRDRAARARYDREQKAATAEQMAQPAQTAQTQGHAVHERPPAPTASPPRRSPRGRPGTVLDFGRYAGLSLGDLAIDDPNYLEWLERTPIGHRLQPEIEALLARSRPTNSRPEHLRSRFSRRR
jgi:curved DNA-binding protein CbpA